MDGFFTHVYAHKTDAFAHPSFTGRGSELATLAEWLVFEEQPHVRRGAIAGMAGIGKTQLVYAYIARHSYRYWAILWLDASSEEAFLADLRATLERLGMPHLNSDAECLDQMYLWLQSSDSGPWLLILDNYQDRSTLIERLLAAKGAGHVIITTRRQAVGVRDTLQLQEMPLEEGMLLLLRRARLLAPDALLETAPSDLVAQASATVQAVGSLPLALDQMGAHLAETGESLSTALTRFQQEPMAFLSKRGTLVEHGESHPDSFVTIYLQLFDELAKLHPLSLEFLRVLAWLPADGVPEALLQRGAPTVTGPLAALLADPIELDEVVADLRKHSLIERRIPTRTLHIHPVVRLLLQVSLSSEQRHAFAQQAKRLSRGAHGV